jgi:hypothetical protein
LGEETAQETMQRKQKNFAMQSSCAKKLFPLIHVHPNIIARLPRQKRQRNSRAAGRRGTVKKPARRRKKGPPRNGGGAARKSIAQGTSKRKQL